MGLGFNFGAKDSGLEAALSGIDGGFSKINSTLETLTASATAAAAPLEALTEGVQERLADLQKDVDRGVDLGQAVDPGAAQEAAGGLEGLGDAIGGMADEAQVGRTGFGRMANSVLGGAGKITSAMGWVGMAIGPIISGFGMAAERAGDMVEAVAGVPSRVGRQIHSLANEGINLTNSLEGEAVGLATTARAVGVNMGYLGGDLRRFIGQATGMAMGLNIGADEAARAIRAWDESAETLGATGLSSARDVARLTAALGVNADILRNSTLELRNLGAEDDQIQLVTSAIAQMGRETGDLSGALNELPQVLQMLERRRALGDTPEQMAAFAADTAAAARGLFEFTQDSDRARSMAQELAGTVTESREAFQNMFAGAEDQLPQIVTELAIVGDDVNAAFDLMSQGPGGLIEGMGQLVQSTRAQRGNVENVLEFMRGRLQQVFGAEMTGTLVNFWRTMDTETVAAMGAIRGASVNLGELGRQAHSTGRTLEEVFERMRAGFQTAFRRVARPAVRDFVRDTRRQLRRLRRSMQSAAADSGALGDVMEQLSLASQIGGLALLPEELRGTAIAADELQGMINPLISAFGTWEGLLETVGAYIALFATEVIMAREETGSWSEAIDQVATRFADIFVRWIDDAEKFITDLVDTFADFDWDNLFGEGGEGTAAGAFGRVIERLADVDWSRIWDRLVVGLNGLFERMRPWLAEKVKELRLILNQAFTELWEAIDWNRVFTGTGTIALAIWNAFEPALMQVATWIGDWFIEHWPEILAWGVVALTAALALVVLGAFLAIVAFILFPWIQLIAVIYLLWETFGDDIVEFFTDLWGRLTEAFDEGVDDWIMVFGVIEDSFSDLGRDIVAWLRRAMTQAGEVFDQAVEDWGAVFDTIIEFFGTIGQSIRGTIGAAVGWISERWDAFVEGLSGVWDSLSEGWSGFLESAQAFWENLMGVPDRLREGWSGIVEFFRMMFTSIREIVGEDLEQVGQLFSNLADVGSRALRFITGTAEEEFGNSIHTIVGEDMAQTEAIMTETATNVSAVMQRVLHDATVQAIVTGFSDGFAQVVLNMEDFSASMVDSFTEMAEGISGIMTALFRSVLTQSEITMMGTETAVEGIIGRLRSITTAQARLASARSAAVAQLARPADEEAMRRRMAQLASNPTLQAIHHPDWYGGAAGQGGFRRLFITHMVQLKEAVEALRTAPTTGGIEARRQLIREAAAGIETAASRVGGHSRLPQRGR